jgi:hypothetical protein
VDANLQDQIVAVEGTGEAKSVEKKMAQNNG